MYNPLPNDMHVSVSIQALEAGKHVLCEKPISMDAAELDALRRYRQEYCRRLQDAMSRGIDAATLANYRRFIRSLDDAIDTALRALDQQDEKVAASQQHWQQRQRQLSSYDTLAERRAAQQRQREQRRELRDNDELTNNAMARRSRQD